MGMTNSRDGYLSEASPHDHERDGEGWWPLLGSSLQRPHAMESTTLTALLLLFIVSTTDRAKALPATGQVLNLVCELQHNHDGAQTDKTQRASVITRLSAALSGLRGELD
jgi:hypothetical protein